MSKDLIEGGPSEGELVVAVVREVKQNGAYVDLDEYEGIEGFIFIGEIPFPGLFAVILVLENL